MCCVLYRHPNSNLEVFLDSLESSLEKVNNENKHCLIMGDFNINLLNSDSHSLSNVFINTLSSYLFQPHIIKPTRITNHSATLIDNIFFNSINNNVISGNLLYAYYDISDHLSNFLIINNLFSHHHKEKIYKREYSNFNKNAFINECKNSINWQELFYGEDDINVLFDTFHQKLLGIVNKHVPLKLITKKEIKFKAKPWITQGLKVSIKIKNQLYQRFIKTRNSFLHSKYKLYRNKIQRLLKVSKAQYYNAIFQPIETVYR